ncbi:MAG: hypothetical protein AB1757_30540 [Acidobacteriota bacterium]
MAFGFQRTLRSVTTNGVTLISTMPTSAQKIPASGKFLSTARFASVRE